MADKPIIFSAAMVQALLAGRKSQTRRLLKPQPIANGFWRDKPRPEPCGWGQEQWDKIYSGEFPDGFRCAQSLPYDTGDRLWVREAWRVGLAYDDMKPSALMGDEIVDYLATTTTASWSMGRKRSPIHMPRWASRLTLTVTDVRVERLQDISEADAIAEGGKAFFDEENPEMMGIVDFRRIWNSIHGPEAWAANPWVVALTFRVEHRNIDDGEPR